MPKNEGLWASAPHNPGPVPSWLAPRIERLQSRSPINPPSIEPASVPSISVPEQAPPSRPLVEMPAPTAAQLRAPRTPTIPPPVIHDHCPECDALKTELHAAHVAVEQKQEELAALRKTLLIECESELVRLALTVAERVVGRELSADPALIATWAREAIESLDSATDAVVAVAPDVAAALEGHTADFGGQMLIDEGLAPMTAQVRGQVGWAEVGTNARMAAIAEALGVDSE